MSLLPENFYDEASEACQRAFEAAAIRHGIVVSTQSGLRPGNGGTRYGGPCDEKGSIAPFFLVDTAPATLLQSIDSLSGNVSRWIDDLAATGVKAITVCERGFRVLQNVGNFPVENILLIWLCDALFTSETTP